MTSILNSLSARDREAVREEVMDDLIEEGWLAPSDMWEITYENGTVESPPYSLPEERAAMRNALGLVKTPSAQDSRTEKVVAR